MNKLLMLAAAVALSVSFFSFQQKPKYDLKASIARGKEIYTAQCVSCHMEQGEGIEDVYPPLAKSDYLMADKKRSIQQVLHGVSGEIKVNGKVYNTEMSGFDLSNEEAADLLNYIRNSWGNKGAVVTPDEVSAARQK